MVAAFMLLSLSASLVPSFVVRPSFGPSSYCTRRCCAATFKAADEGPAVDEGMHSPETPIVDGADATAKELGDETKAGAPVLAGLIVALVALGGLLDQQSVIDAQGRAYQSAVDLAEGPRVKAYMSAQSPDRYPFPARPGEDYFREYYEKSTSQ